MKNGCVARMVFFVAAGVVICWAQNDYITLKNGQTAKTTVKDTAGCRVTIIRGGTSVQIEKSRIRYVRWGKDSISYETYACPEAPKKGVRFEDTPAYKILSFLDTCPELSQVVKPGEKIGYVPGAIAGTLDRQQDSALQKSIIPLLSIKNTVILMRLDTLAEFVAQGRSPFRYVFMTKKYVDVVWKDTKGELARGEQTSRDVFAVGDFVLIDLERKEIVFHSVIRMKKKVSGWASPGFSLGPHGALPGVGDFMPREYKEKKVNENTQEAIGDNWDDVIEKLEKELKRHFDIKKSVEF